MKEVKILSPMEARKVKAGAVAIGGGGGGCGCCCCCTCGCQKNVASQNAYDIGNMIFA